MTDSSSADWRVLDGIATAWFDAASLSEAAALADRVATVSSGVLSDVRTTGVRVRAEASGDLAAVSDAARDLGLTADPARLQQLTVVLESPDPSAITAFWQRALDYVPDETAGLADGLRRGPAMRFGPAADPRPLRNRVHLDVVRPADAVEQADLGDASGPFGVRHADGDGNEVDLVPGDPLGDGPATADWQAVFAAMACYRVTAPPKQRELVRAAASLADDAGFPLLIDLRPGLVILDSGKDQWDADAHGRELDFVALAADVQAAARDLGATADPGLPRFVQLFLDAADVAAVRAFWAAALGYVVDRRAGVTDIYDPLRLAPEFVFQELDVTETERRRQRNRIHVELVVPAEIARARVATAVDAGGRVLGESPDRWNVADPEGNELVIVSGG